MPTTPSRAVIRDIAAAAGVSVATVSRVLNDRPDVSSVTRDVVLRQIQEHGYVPRRAARALAGGRTGLIGLTLPFMLGDYFGQIVSGAIDALYERDARVVVCPTHHERRREASLLERLMHGTTDGGLLILPSETPAELAALQQQGYPFVVIDPRVPLHESVPVVASANWAGARMVTEYLLGLGHTRIGVITGTRDWYATVDRVAGYQSALLTAGIPFNPRLVVGGDFTIEGGYNAAHRLLSRSQRPTAIFAFNDNMAVGLLHAAQERGLAVPGNLSIAGYDDVEPAHITTPQLTTVAQPLQEMGRVAVDLLFRLLDGQPLHATRLELSSRLVVRASTSPPGKS
jgi:LacI family transcriptional regulator